MLIQDDVGGEITISCDPPSGSVFNIGFTDWIVQLQMQLTIQQQHHLRYKQMNDDNINSLDGVVNDDNLDGGPDTDTCTSGPRP